jgi:hypothetical protein
MSFLIQFIALMADYVKPEVNHVAPGYVYKSWRGVEGWHVNKKL